ncbi:hypothetical protein [Dyella koreensis]|uniref:Uncharacterized protein n=1 Tax=Dyella koreensis TaxID=311235 RepID=A0ABW8KBR8_9GAMM
MEEANEAKVSMLLLGFCNLSKTEQDLFVEGLNRFLFVSPGKRRQLIERLKKASHAENAKRELRASGEARL